eukprot:TRINITY_DN2039_c0_g1_i2.p1 TRINITY_DN2039_c0_g1~~TRINITY_DN2039_c0_g1_i2.p1  ORF type:complete len:300 (-),score=36.81 TRINITY_DN2039_c0_g1_i2:124-1023(-)
MSAASNTTLDYESMKVPELKEILRSKGLRVGGNKAELIDRLEGREITTSRSRKRKARNGGDPEEVHPSIDVSFVSQVEKEDVKTITLGPLRNKLKAYIRYYHQLVNDNWHDGDEGQTESLNQFCTDTVRPVYQAIINIADKGVGFQYCNEVLVVVADWWEEIQSISVRFEYDDIAFEPELLNSDEEYSYQSMNDAISYMWGYVLFAAVKSNTDRQVVNQIIADANSFGWNKDGVFDEFDYPEELESSQEPLQEIIETGEWQQSRGRYKSHPEKKVIDARYDEPKHKRTRDYDLDEGCWF